MRYKKFYEYYVYENGDIRNKHGHLMTPYPYKDEYRVKLSTGDGSRCVYNPSQLVYSLFNDISIHDKGKSLVIDYRDGDSTNNHINNLIMDDRLCRDVNHRVLYSAEVDEIIEIYENNQGKTPTNQHTKGGDYVSYTDLAKRYNVSRATIFNIIKNK